MTIYISHSRSFDFQNELYSVLTSSIGRQHSLIFPHDDEETPFPTKDFLESQECDLVLAEVSKVSTGQGIELGWAEMLHIPIVCIYKKNAKISQSLYLITNKFVEYLDEKDLGDKVEKIVSHLSTEKI